MHLLVLATVMLAAATGAEPSPCDLVPEQEIPNCHFTLRSNFALHGPVRTVRVTTRKLAPDPRTRSPNAHAARSYLSGSLEYGSVSALTAT